MVYTGKHYSNFNFLCPRYCYQSFLDYQRCKKIRGEEFDACQYYKRVSKSICPNAWIDKWNTQIEENRFPGNI